VEGVAGRGAGRGEPGQGVRQLLRFEDAGALHALHRVPEPFQRADRIALAQGQFALAERQHQVPATQRDALQQALGPLQGGPGAGQVATAAQRDGELAEHHRGVVGDAEFLGQRHRRQQCLDLAGPITAQAPGLGQGRHGDREPPPVADLAEHGQRAGQVLLRDG
jgi:hypothetical protein